MDAVRQWIPSGDQRLGRFGCQLAQSFTQMRQFDVRKSGTDSAGIMQLPMRIVVTQVQRAQSSSIATWRCPSQYNKFVASAALHRHPTRSAAGLIERVCLLAEDSLQTKAAGLLP